MWLQLLNHPQQRSGLGHVGSVGDAPNDMKLHGFDRSHVDYDAVK